MTVRTSTQSVELEPYTYCYGSVCADGMPPADPADVGSPDQVVVEFPLSDWDFTASFRPAGQECGRVIQTELPRRDDTTHLLRPTGVADTYKVTLAGRGDGDLFVEFLWTTPTDGRLPEPESRLAVLADHDGKVDSYGVELEVQQLPQTPHQATATITVADFDGDSITFDADRATQGCQPEGTVSWQGPAAKGKQAARLGPGPYTYEVELVLDGNRETDSPNYAERGGTPGSQKSHRQQTRNVSAPYRSDRTPG